MEESRTGSHLSGLPDFQRSEPSAAPWWLLCCRVFTRRLLWRRVAIEVPMEEVARAQGKAPPEPLLPAEPIFTGSLQDQEARKAYAADRAVWNERVHALRLEYQESLTAWQALGWKHAQKWEMRPTPELAPFDSRPPESREWVPPRGIETWVRQAEEARRFPASVRNWRFGPEGKWEETLKRGKPWAPYSSKELRAVSGQCSYLPEGLLIAVPGWALGSFLRQAEQEALSLLPARWDMVAGQLEPAGQVPQLLLQPVLEVVASVALTTLGVMPVKQWPDVPSSVWEELPGWQPGQQVPTTRQELAALEHWLREQAKVPNWAATPDYRSQAALNLCWVEAREQRPEAFLWQPLLEAYGSGLSETSASGASLRL
ncbi:MAG: hypothetical protein H6Q00_1434 [Holophagaceae bacterium]|nr:hypothetical protein [Holophagaceae bacterium]